MAGEQFYCLVSETMQNQLRMSTVRGDDISLQTGKCSKYHVRTQSFTQTIVTKPFKINLTDGETTPERQKYITDNTHYLVKTTQTLAQTQLD